MSDNLKSREQSFMESFERKEAVCSHIHKAALTGQRNMLVYPLCVQVYEDGYVLFWYCDECIKSYGLSSCGTYVYDAEDELRSRLEDLQGFELNVDEDQNPFSEFLEQEDGHFLKKSEFAEFNVNFDTEKPLENGKLKRIPFGSQWVDKVKRQER